MDPVSVALVAVQRIAKLADDAQNNSEDCKLLAKLVQKTNVLLTKVDVRTQDALCKEPGLKHALDVLVDALRTTEEAIERCQKSSAVVALLRASNHNLALKHAAAQLSHALEIFPLGSLRLTMKIKEDVYAISKQLGSLRFHETELASKQTDQLQRAMEVGFNANMKESAEVKDMLKRLLQARNRTPLEAQEDIELLKTELDSARVKKDKMEEYQLKQIITALETTSWQAAPKLVEETVENEDLPRYLVCPISQQIMNDPVLVVQSGMTYDRESIEEWFALGHTTDPETNVSLTSLAVVPNITIRRAVTAFRQTRGDVSDPGNTSVRRDYPIPEASSVFALPVDAAIQPGLKPGLVTMSGALVTIQGKRYEIELTALFEPDGNLQGYATSKSEDLWDGVYAYFKGEWDVETLAVSLVIFDAYDVATPTAVAADRPRFTLTGAMHTLIEAGSTECGYAGRWRYQNPSTKRTPKVSVNSGTFLLRRVLPCETTNDFKLHPGLWQFEGKAVGDNGYVYPSLLLLMLRPDGNVLGWQTEITPDNPPFEYSTVSEGTWDPKLGKISFELFFGSTDDLPQGKQNSSDNNDVSYQYKGTLPQPRTSILSTMGLFSRQKYEKAAFEGRWHINGYESYEACRAAVDSNKESAAELGHFSFDVFRRPKGIDNPLNSDALRLLNLQSDE